MKNLIHLVRELAQIRQLQHKISVEGSEPLSRKDLIAIATGIARQEAAYPTAEKAWELYEACNEVYNNKQIAIFEGKSQKLLGRLEYPLSYEDSCRLITEEGRADRAEEKFRNFLKYYCYQGHVPTSQLERQYEDPHTAMLKKNLGGLAS